MVIDAHAHIIVPEATAEAPADGDWRPRVTWTGDGTLIEHRGRALRSAVRPFVEIEAILAAQGPAGVDRLVLSPWVNLAGYDLPAEEGLRVSRVQNEALARLAQAHPGRVSALGNVPLQEPELAARELEAVMALPGLGGVQIATMVRGVYLGDPRFEPFWAAAAALGALVFIHPTMGGLSVPPFAEYYMQNTVGNPLETAITAAHMVMAGVLERHPGLRVLLAHGGGALLALRGRLRHAHSFHPQARARLQEPPDVSIGRFYFDTVTHDAELLRQLVAFAGAERVLLGSDYPFDMGAARPAEIVRGLELPPADEALILGGNAARLLGLAA
ncbi:MAG TPA: amidohydrolase family protein [Chloroflexaceae bacterium]|nr:amidohydrolase family protein [Chloroflexaceae bacterium]